MTICLKSKFLIYPPFLRCNGNNDCMDASDELSCSKISVLDSYLNEVPAPPLHGNNLTDITIDVIIIKEQ